MEQWVWVSYPPSDALTFGLNPRGTGLGVHLWRSMNPIEATKNVKPEFIRVDKATELFGIGRTKLYELMASGKVKAYSLRQRGQVKGTRLISYDSLVEFIENQQPVANL